MSAVLPAFKPIIHLSCTRWPSYEKHTFELGPCQRQEIPMNSSYVSSELIVIYIKINILFWNYFLMPDIYFLRRWSSGKFDLWVLYIGSTNELCVCFVNTPYAIFCLIPVYSYNAWASHLKKLAKNFQHLFSRNCWCQWNVCKTFLMRG